MKRIVWTDPAKADIRSISKPTAMQILFALHRFAESGVGDVKALQGRESSGCVRVTTDSSSSAQLPIPSKFGESDIVAKPTDENLKVPPL